MLLLAAFVTLLAHIAQGLPVTDDAMAKLLGSNSTHFVREIYGQRHAIFPAPLAPTDNWLARDPLLNSFAAEADLNRSLATLVNLYGRSQDAIAFRDRHAANVPLDTLLERVSLEHLYDYLVQHGYSVVIREEYFPTYTQTSLEELIQTAFGTSTVTSHVYLSGSEAHALNPHTDPYDVLVLHLHGQKHWTVCHPLDSSPEWADASQAQLAQLFEIQRKSVDGCTNFDIAETDKMRCEHFTLSPGDVLYLPKSTIHFATTSPNTTTAHITLSLERQGQSWIDLACTVIESTLASLETSPSGLRWLELATFPTDEPCQMAQKRLLGFEKDSLRTLVAQDPQLSFTYVTSKDILTTLQRLASCTASLGWDSREREVTLEGLLTNPATHYDSGGHLTLFQNATTAVMPAPVAATAMYVFFQAKLQKNKQASTHQRTLALAKYRAAMAVVTVAVTIAAAFGETVAIAGGYLDLLKVTKVLTYFETPRACDSCDSSCDDSCSTNCATCTGGCNSGKTRCSSCNCRAGHYFQGGNSLNIATSGCRGTYSGSTSRTSPCSTCPSGTFQPSTGATSCLSCSSSGTKCNTGRYTTGCAGASAGSCTACATNYYQSQNSVYKTACTQCSTCNAGQSYTCNANSGLACTACGVGTYQASNAHRSTSCLAQNTCGAGSYFSGNIFSAGSCTTCSYGTYIATSAHRTTSCTPWPTCPAGTFKSGATTSSGGSCAACGSGTFQTTNSHILTSCSSCAATGKVCGTGQYQSGCAGPSAGACSSCPANTYQASSSHRLASCTNCRTCGKGQYLANCAGATGPGICQVCNSGTYQSQTAHQERTCPSCASCSPGYYRDGCGGESAGTCVACASGFYQSQQTYATSCYPCPGCPSGYTRTGCGGSAEGTCVGLVCPALPAVSSAVLTYSNSERRYPVIATFACVAGFEQTGGDASRSCTPALTWAGAEIICTRVSCGDLPALSNGFVDTSGGVDFESVATFSCDEGYTRSGPASRTCQASGEWSGSAPMCVALPCPSLPVFAHGSATSSSSNPIVVTFQAVDDCGNMDQANATIVRRDTTPPVFVEFPDNVTVSCSAAEPTNFTVAVTDICTGNATVVLAQTWTEPSATCAHAYTVFRTWTASDVCGNKLNLTHTVNVVDETAPTLPSGVPTTVLECNADSTRDDVTALLEAHVNISAADACGGNAITWSFDALNLSSTLTGNYSAQLYAHDDCANVLPVAAPISIVDTQPPVLSNLSVAMAYECDAVPQTEDVVVRDACDTNVQVVFGDNITQGQCPQSYTLARTIWATDNAGWQDNFTQFLTVVDTTAPQWVAPPADVVFECDGAGNTANVTWWLESFGNGTAQDACSSNVTWQSNGANATWSQGCGQTLATSVQFSVQDECGNVRTHTASFAALDTQPPVLYWANTTVAPVSTAAPASITGASTSNTSSSASTTTGPAATSAPAGDEPVYLVGPPPNMTLECIGRAGLEPTRPDPYMVMARDVCSGSEYDVAYEETRHDGHCMGLVRYVRAWTAVDSCSNAGTMYQTVAIQDTTPPQVQSPPQDLQLECDRESSAGQLQQWLDAAGYGIAEDTCSDVTWSHNLTDPMTTFHACEGMNSMVVRFTVTDDCGNAAHAFATVNVVDTQAPIITAMPPAHTIECDLASQDAQIEAWLLQSGNALAVDGCSDTLSRNYTSSQQTMCANTKVVTANFSFTDTCGWQASALGTLSVQDTVPPTIILRGSNATTSEAGFAWLDPGVEAAFDTCQGAINISIVQRQHNVNISTLGEQAIEYAVADDCQNTGSINMSDFRTGVVNPLYGGIDEAQGATYDDADADGDGDYQDVHQEAWEQANDEDLEADGMYSDMFNEPDIGEDESGYLDVGADAQNFEDVEQPGFGFDAFDPNDGFDQNGFDDSYFEADGLDQSGNADEYLEADGFEQEDAAFDDEADE
ncbi:uncharacterized protein MONBRDRAFT_32951 [Monosiga brevicollis MX1]|uniref:Ribosomal oxygenase 2 n=1 Tax=Monosiga brevicollis TaxID=81824 RepID=A9V2P6_MONBE|nr:uncharacterized protein MONBRDRAFT_32951 [Monosiga brevicollis MX1]EDQ88297.1 predicted protein [Monosiga brevicollis MX1]|eukprot:XP_001746890.1 hypothetical protein [Monosiga brevicollis MX1]